MRHPNRIVLLVSLFLTVFPTTRPLCASIPAQEPDSVRELGFESGIAGEPPAGWLVPKIGWVANLAAAEGAEGELCTVLASTGDAPGSFGSLTQWMDAGEYRGRSVQLSARIRVESAKIDGSCRMWFGYTRPGTTPGAFGGAGDRLIVPGDWTTATIEIDVEADAERIAVSFTSMGDATVLVDSVKLRAGPVITYQEPSPPRALTPRGLENVAAAARLLAYVRFFHPSDQVVAVRAWDHFAISVLESAELAEDASDLARRLQEAFAPIAPALTLWAGEPAAAPAIASAPAGAAGLASFRHLGAGSVAGERPNVYSTAVTRSPFASHAEAESRVACFRDKRLGGGVWCRIPIEVYYDDEGTLPRAGAPAEWTFPATKLTARARSTRLAGVALCWGVMQHFYPYFDVVETDWDPALGTALAKAARDEDEPAFRRTLLELVAKLHDGHGGVYGPQAEGQTMLPLAFAWAGTELVVTGKHRSAYRGVAVGDVVVSIDGQPVEACYEAMSRFLSAATEGYRRHASLSHLQYEFPTADPVVLRVRHPDGTECSTTVDRIPLTQIDDVTAKRPVTGEELVPGIVYFDLDETQAVALHHHMETLRGARGIVFDLRGYPGSAAYELIPYLIEDEATSAHWNVPVVTLPDREGWTWESSEWHLEPAAEPIDAEIAFLTDGRAISYAESIMGIVEHYRLGEIVGSTTAGTNGNVNPLDLPGGYTIWWTGMQVLKHDGSRHHGVGIQPTVPVEPTARGIAEGSDEVLEKAVDILEAKIRGDDR